jgi:hypothetical protein
VSPRIAKENGVPIVPLLEESAVDPRLFGRDVEYTRFHIHDAAKIFASVVAAKRKL